MASRSNRSVPPPISSSAKLKQASYFVRMLHSVVLISLRLTGLSSTIPRMIPTIIFTELVELAVDLKVVVAPFSSCSNMSSVSCVSYA